MKEIVKVLMGRDGISKEDAESLFDMAHLDLNERLAAGEMPYNICEKWFGLEPEYLTELLDFFKHSPSYGSWRK